MGGGAEGVVRVEGAVVRAARVDGVVLVAHGVLGLIVCWLYVGLWLVGYVVGFMWIDMWMLMFCGRDM